MLSTQSAKRARCKNTNHSCGTLQGVRLHVFERVLLNNAYWQSINTKKWSFDRICKAQLSYESKTLMDKSMLERYRKCKCCVFIDFEYIYIHAITSIDISIHYSFSFSSQFVHHMHVRGKNNWKVLKDLFPLSIRFFTFKFLICTWYMLEVLIKPTLWDSFSLQPRHVQELDRLARFPMLWFVPAKHSGLVTYVHATRYGHTRTTEAQTQCGAGKLPVCLVPCTSLNALYVLLA